MQAAHAVGFDNLTMKTVADHLGVSVASLYHYVRGKDDLVRLAAELSAGRIRLPEDHGQHWATWLYEWGIYNRDAFVAQPGILKQFIDGAIGADRTAETLDTALGTLVRQGFSIHEARIAYSLVSELAIGAAVAVLREQQAAAAGRPTLAELYRAVALHDDDELVYVRAVLQEAVRQTTDSFHEGLLTSLRGIAAQRGERWRPIESKLERMTPRR